MISLRLRLVPLTLLSLTLLVGNVIYFVTHGKTTGYGQIHQKRGFSTRSVVNRAISQEIVSNQGDKGYIVQNETLVSKGETPNETLFTTQGNIFSTKTPTEQQPSCSVKSDWTRYLLYPKVTTNFTFWNDAHEISCSNDKFHLNASDSFVKFSFRCSDDYTKMETFYQHVNERRTNMDIQVVKFRDKCLRKFIDTCCYDTLRVPNVVHYVIFNKTELRFFEFVSFLSVVRFVQPCAILIHGDILPNGSYWDHIRAIFPNIIHVQRRPPTIIFGHRRGFAAHSSDIMRIEALIEYGGIYIDTDTLFVKPIDYLRSFPCTISAQSSNVTSSAFISSEKNSTFVKEWLKGYKKHYLWYHYTYNAMTFPFRLAKRIPGHINVLKGSMSRPWNQIGTIVYETNYKWDSIYGIHLFARRFKKKMDEDEVKIFNSTVGSITRHILFGNKELCRK